MPIALSIDNFLDAHQGNDSIELCGKLAITKAVLDAEAGSPMCDKDDRPFDLSSLSRTWYLRLAQLMTEDVQRRDAERAVANLSIITFNYDRCIEHFLRHALITYYQIQPADAEALACKIPIAHPYGQVGNLEWQACDTWVPFGRPDSADLLPTSKQIRTFAERIDDETAVEKIHNMVRNAETIVFLGFAFHRQNLELLTPPDGIAGEFKKVLGTSMGLSQSDIGVINAEVARMLAYRRHDGRFHHDNLETVPLTCSEFLAAYGRTLTN
ncbi:MAG: hypothetical protein QOH47_2335 [Sphingomonadales bacterium]|nr:hypothetical protein [Sphingomonadales bacterium]